VKKDWAALGIAVNIHPTSDGKYDELRSERTSPMPLEVTPTEWELKPLIIKPSLALLEPFSAVAAMPTPTPQPTAPAAVAYLGILDDNVGEMRNAEDMLLGAPRTSDVFFDVVTATAPVDGSLVARVVDEQYLVLPLFTEAATVAVLEHRGVSGLHFTGDAAMLSLAEVTVTR
jgi:hypothetical protein